MTMNDNILTCKICGYQSKQLFQHIKAMHKMTTQEYRDIYGQNEIMQIGFISPIKKANFNDKRSKQVKNSYKKIKEKLENINYLHDKKETQHLLLKNDYYKNFLGRTKQRTLLKTNPKLYKSIYKYSDILLKHFKSITLPQRLTFIVEFNYDLEKCKCYCGHTYTFNKYCRYCPIDRSHVKDMIRDSKYRLKCRLGAIAYLEKCHGQLAPRYNINSIPIIESYGKEHNYNFQHAENGGEYYINGLGYWVDAYDKENNIVLEIDEKHHFNKNGDLKEKDIQRQKEITELLKCKFIRIVYEK